MGASAKVRVLVTVANGLKRGRGSAVPALFYIVDPGRDHDPVGAALRLPRGTGVVYRHFGGPERVRIAAGLARAARLRGLVLLIGADARLARCVKAGVHVPERRALTVRAVRSGCPWGPVTVAAHGKGGVARAARLGAAAALVSSVFPSRSPSAPPPLGVVTASRWAKGARLPVIAMGGVTPQTAPLLRGSGFAGLAAAEALSLAGFKT